MHLISFTNVTCKIVRKDKKWCHLKQKTSVGHIHRWYISRLMIKPTMWLCAQRRLRSAWASAQSDQSLRCPHEESSCPELPTERTAKTLIRLCGYSGWSESSLGAQSFCWFYHEVAHIFVLVQGWGDNTFYMGFEPNEFTAILHIWYVTLEKFNPNIVYHDQTISVLRCVRSGPNHPISYWPKPICNKTAVVGCSFCIFIFPLVFLYFVLERKHKM